MRARFYCTVLTNHIPSNPFLHRWGLDSTVQSSLITFHPTHSYCKVLINYIPSHPFLHRWGLDSILQSSLITFHPTLSYTGEGYSLYHIVLTHHHSILLPSHINLFQYRRGIDSSKQPSLTIFHPQHINPFTQRELLDSTSQPSLITLHPSTFHINPFLHRQSINSFNLPSLVIFHPLHIKPFPTKVGARLVYNPHSSYSIHYTLACF